MPISTALQNQIEAIQARIDTIMPEASPEDVVMLAKAIEAVGGQATVFDVIEIGEAKKAEIALAAQEKIADVEASGEDAKQQMQQLVTSMGAFSGASEAEDGSVGLVTKPLAGQQDSFLKGDGSWESITEIPIGGLAILHPAMDTTNFLPANGGAALVEDYPELAEVLGRTPSLIPHQMSGTEVVLTADVSTPSLYHSVVVQNNMAAIVTTTKGINYTSNNGKSWLKSPNVSLGTSIMKPVMSDTGCTIGVISNTEGVFTMKSITGNSFGNWQTPVIMSLTYTQSASHSITIGLNNGVGIMGSQSAGIVGFQFFTDKSSTFGPFANVTQSTHPEFKYSRGLFRIKDTLVALGDNQNNTTPWRGISCSSDGGTSWALKWSGSDQVWHSSDFAPLTGTVTNKQDAFQRAYEENGTGFVHHLSDKILIIREDGYVSETSAPGGNAFIFGSISFLDGEYYALCSGGVYKTTDFESWNLVATPMTIIGAPGSLVRMWVYKEGKSFGFLTSVNNPMFVQTFDFIKYKRANRPTRWSEGTTSSNTRRLSLANSRFVWLIVDYTIQHLATSSTTPTDYTDSALFDLITGRMYATIRNSKQSTTPHWSYSLGEEGLLSCNSTSITIIRISDIYNYNSDIEFRLPRSSGDFSIVGAYGNNPDSLFLQEFRLRGLGGTDGYSFYVRAK